MVPIRDFSGLINSAWALASAAAIVPIVSLERCTATLRFEEVKADGPRFRALGADAMADSFLGVLWHQGLQLSFGPLMIQKRLPCAAEEIGKFGQEFEALISTIRTASILGFGGSTPKTRGDSPLSTQRQNLRSAVTIRCWYTGSA